jgi:hypothetical protein
MKKLHLVNSLTAIGLSTIGWVCLTLITASKTTAQTKPICFMTDTEGNVTDLSNLCNERSTQNSTTEPINRLNNLLDTVANSNSDRFQVENVYFVGNGDVPFSLGSVSSTYYTGDRSVYVRKYRSSLTTDNRNAARNALLESGANSNNAIVTVPGGFPIVPGRTPFIIYRYQK